MSDKKRTTKQPPLCVADLEECPMCGEAHADLHVRLYPRRLDADSPNCFVHCPTTHAPVSGFLTLDLGAMQAENLRPWVRPARIAKDPASPSS